MLAPGSFAPGTIVPTAYRSNYSNDDNFWSQEGRIESKTGHRLGWVAGVYYFQQDYNETYWENIPGAGAVLANPIQGGQCGPALAAPNPNKSTFAQQKPLSHRIDGAVRQHNI